MGEVWGWGINTLGVLRVLVLRPGGQSLGASVVPAFQEACRAPLYACPHTYFLHRGLCFLPIYMPCRFGGEDLATYLTKGMGKNKGRDRSLHNP